MKMLMKSAAAAALMLVPAAVAPTPANAGSEPYVGEIMYFGGNFCPRNWLAANGQLLPVNGNDALFSLLGTIYGGDGRTTFGLPDLRGRAPVHQGTGPGLSTKRLGQKGGAETIGLTVSNLAPHNHLVNATNAQGDKLGPGTDYLADPNTNDPNTELQIYSDAPANRQMSSKMIANAGQNQSVDIESPYLGLQACIALFGIYPPRS